MLPTSFSKSQVQCLHNFQFECICIFDVRMKYTFIKFKVNAKSCFADKMHLFLMQDFREFISIYENHASETFESYVRRIKMQRNKNE